MVDEDYMNRTSAACLDILVGKPGFPDHAFVLYDGGWFTFHRILGRSEEGVAGGILTGTDRMNFAPKQEPDFQGFLDRMITGLEERDPGRYRNMEVALIPYSTRKEEALSLGEIIGSQTFPDGITMTTLEYRQGKRIRIYSPPNLS